MEKLISTNSLNLNRDDVAALRDLAARTMKKGLISHKPQLQIGSDLLLRASGAKKIVSRPVESGKVQVPGRGTLTVYKVYADGVDLGYQVSETVNDGQETLVGERVRTLEAGKAFAKNPGDPASNEFVALWSSPRIDAATRRLRIQRRFEDRVWAPAVGAALVSEAPRGYIDIDDLPKTEEEAREEACEEDACDLLKYIASPVYLRVLQLTELQSIALAMGVAPKVDATEEDLVASLLPRIHAAINTGRAPKGVIDVLRKFATPPPEVTPEVTNVEVII